MWPGDKAWLCDTRDACLVSGRDSVMCPPVLMNQRPLEGWWCLLILRSVGTLVARAQPHLQAGSPAPRILLLAHCPALRTSPASLLWKSIGGRIFLGYKAVVVGIVRCLRPLIAWVREGEETGIRQGSSCLTGSGLLSSGRLAASYRASLV